MRHLIDLATRVLGMLRRGRRISPRSGTPLKVNLGSGLAVAPGWLNIDGSLNALIASWPSPIHRLMYACSGASRYYSADEYCSLLSRHEFLHHDLSWGIPLPDACADHLYTSHFLEHLDREAGERLLAEAYRVLKPGGTMRVCVPDLAHAVALYARGDKRKMLSEYFFVEDPAGGYSQHRYMYDLGLLSELLRDVGFDWVEQRAFREGGTPDLVTLDRYPADTLFVEAGKGA